MDKPLKTPKLRPCSLKEAIDLLSQSGDGQMPAQSLKLALLVDDDVMAVMAARILAYHIPPSQIYLPQTYQAFFEMDPWAQAVLDSAELVQVKPAKFAWPKRGSYHGVVAKALASEGVNTAVILANGGSSAQKWTSPEVFDSLCEGLSQVLMVQDFESPMADPEVHVPTLQAGPLSLARATHVYRSKSPNTLKALVFLTAGAWLGQKPEVSKQLVSWLDEQQATAARLKLGLDINRLCFTAADRLQQRQLKDAATALQACTWRELLGYMAYADLIACDQKELIHLAKCLGKSNCKLL